MRVTRIYLLRTAGIFGLCVANTLAASDTEIERFASRTHGDWWLGVDTGAGAVHLELPEGSISENKFYLGVRAEYVLNPEFILGIEASGWLIQPGEIEYNTNPPPNNYQRQIEGEGLAPILLTARYYPWDDSSWHLKAGAGYVRLENASGCYRKRERNRDCAWWRLRNSHQPELGYDGFHKLQHGQYRRRRL